MKNAKRKKPKRTMPYIRAVLDRLTRRRWPDWKQEFAYERLLWERFLWRCRDGAMVTTEGRPLDLGRK